MPCSQMMSMNMSPPRANDDKKLDRVPKVKARILKSWRRNMGWATRVSMTMKAPRRSAPRR